MTSPALTEVTKICGPGSILVSLQIGARGPLLEDCLQHWLLRAAASPSATPTRAATAAHFGACQVWNWMSEEHFGPLPLQGGQSCPAVLRAEVLPFDDRDGPQFDGLFADASIMAGVHHVSHILVGLRSLFHNQFGRGNTDCDAHICQFV